MRRSGAARTAPRRHDAARPVVPACCHHWLIEPPHGPIAAGVCKLCGARREFRTSSDDYIREDAVASVAA